MARVQLPPVQNKSGRYVEGQRIISVTDTDGNAWPCYTTRTGSTPVNFSTMRSGPEGEFQAYASPNTVVITYENDLHDNPKTIELVSGEDLEGMLTEDDLPGFPETSFSPLDFGGDPTGLTDSTAALQAAIDAADAVDGTVHLGNGTAIWSFSSQITGASAIRITSSASGGVGGSGKPKLRYTGTGSGAAVLFASKQRFEIDHVQFEYTSSSFTGPLLYLQGNSVSGDIIRCHVHHCHFDYQGSSDYHAQGLKCHKIILSTISQCGFNQQAAGLILGDTNQSASYVNGVHVYDCHFNDIYDDDFPHGRGQIEIGSTDMEGCCIDNCSFEAAGANALTAIRGTNQSEGDARSNLVYNLTIRNCWFGDTSGPTVFIKGINGVSDYGPVNVENNFFGGATTTAFMVGDTGCSVNFTCNRNDGPYLLDTNGESGSEAKHLVYINNVGGMFDPTATVMEYTCLDQGNNGVPNHMSGGLALAHHSDFDDVGTWPSDTTLVLGGRVPSASGLINQGDKGAIYSRLFGTDRALVVACSTTDDDNEVQIVAGTTPVQKIRANATGVAFNNQTPAARPDYTLTNPTTDRTLNASGTVLSSGGTVPLQTADANVLAETRQVLGTLIQDLTNIGLLQ